MIQQPNLQPNIIYKQNVFKSLSQLPLTALFIKESLFTVCLILYFAIYCVNYTNSLIDSYISVQKIWQIQKYYRKILTKYRNKSTF